MKNLLVLMLCISGAGFVACGSDDDTDEADEEGGGDGDNDDNNNGDGDVGEVDCTGDLPTYDDFGKDFVEEYCSSCHAADVKGADRMGAPTDDVFDSLDQIQGKADEMANLIASGAMPYGAAPKPSDDEKTKAVTWLKCDPQ